MLILTEFPSLEPSDILDNGDDDNRISREKVIHDAQAFSRACSRQKHTQIFGSIIGHRVIICFTIDS